MSDISNLFYQYLLFSNGSKYTETSVTNTFPNTVITKPLLEFFKSWNSIRKIVIDGLDWRHIDTSIDIDHEKKTVDFILSDETMRNHAAERDLKELSESIFTDYTISVNFEWDESNWVVG